ncbi:MAG: HD domain-containing protein [Clostridia bacterium]|nr:HD domain-containing protein [Clostridia bacterium]MDD4387330.1 HD domain-containing protein [Clostridia bacterium]
MFDRIVVDKIQNEIEIRSKSPDNFYGIGVYYHIKAVEKSAIYLAKIYGADIEIVQLAALLHDIASITKKEYTEKHHIYGAEIAEKLLKELNYPIEKIELIKKCILNHRGSVLVEKTTKEEICVADADAMAHFDMLPALFNMVYRQMELSIDEGAKYLKNKLTRSYNKLTNETKELYAEKIKSVMSIFE